LSTPEVTPQSQDITLEQLKEIHDYYVVTIQILTQNTQHYFEEFEYIDRLVKFYKAILLDTKSKIDALTPKVEAE